VAVYPEDQREPEPPPDVVIRDALLEQTGLRAAYQQVGEFRYALDVLVRQMLPAMVRGLAGDAAVAAHERQVAERLARLAPPPSFLLKDL
jgi:hypothetical protein